MATHSSLTIGGLARATGTKVETVRYYEQIGLLPLPPRTTGNYRSYAAGHVQRLTFIRRSRDLGFTIEQVRDLLHLADRKDRSCDHVDRIAREHLAKIEAKIADLMALGEELRDLVGKCRHGTIAECRIIEALAPKSPDTPRPNEKPILLQ